MNIATEPNRGFFDASSGTFTFTNRKSPYRDLEGSIRLSRRRGGDAAMISIYLDHDGDGAIGQSEKLYRGMVTGDKIFDRLLNTKGRIRLIKKSNGYEKACLDRELAGDDEPCIIPAIYIPTTYDCSIKPYQSERMKVNPMGDFLDPYLSNESFNQ